MNVQNQIVHPIFRIAKTMRHRLPFQNRLYSALRRLKLPEPIYRHLPIVGWITIKTAAGSFQMFSNGDIVENALFWSQDRRGDDSISFQAWERLAAASTGTILDIGANTGLYALIARTANPAAPVIAFEPVTRIADKLSRNVAANGYDIEVVTKAVSDHNGSAMFHDSADPSSATNAYSSSLEDSFAFNKHSYAVDIVKIDEFIHTDRQVSLIKIDVELHEVSAVRGMMNIIERDTPSLLIEILNDDIARDLTALLTPFGYEFYQIDERKGLVRSTVLKPLGGHNFNNLACGPGTGSSAILSDLMLRP